MSFWTSELGEITGNANDAFAKVFILVPDNTAALAKIKLFEEGCNEDEHYLFIEWLLIEGEFKGQTITQKIKVFDRDPKVRHRALNMLKLIYQLFKISPTHGNVPTKQDLMIFIGKIAGIRIRETPPNEKGKQYNWVSEVHNASGFQCEAGKKLEIVHKNTESHQDDLFDTAFSRNPRGGSLPDDDIPFN